MSIKFQAKHKSGFTVDVLEPFTFPAGEAHIKGFDTLNVNDYEYFIADIRGHNPQDLFHLAMWASGLDDAQTDESAGLPVKYVLLPYIPGARADRGVPFGAQVYANFFNDLFLDNIIVLDPHSPVAPALFQNGDKFPSDNVVEFPFERIIQKELGGIDSGYTGVIAPDKGAHDRAQRAADVLHVPVYTAGKTRDFETGKLTGFHMEDELPTEGKFLLVDDLCDGGGTFNGLADTIKKVTPHVELDLWVTHGVFSQGIFELQKRFGTVHTTDSYFQPKAYIQGSGGDWPIGSFLKVHSITPYLYSDVANIHNNTKDTE